MRINALNEHDIDAFLSDLAKGKEPLAAYLKIALKKAILKEEDCFTPQDTYPKNPPAWLTREKFESGEFAVFDRKLISNSMLGQISHIKDWIGGAIASNRPWIQDLDGKGRPRRLLQISTIEDAFQRADKERTGIHLFPL